MHNHGHDGVDCEIVVVKPVTLDPYRLSFETLLPGDPHSEAHSTFIVSLAFRLRTFLG